MFDPARPVTIAEILARQLRAMRRLRPMPKPRRWRLI